MDASSKKIVKIIAAATLGTMAVMAFKYYNQPAAENAAIAEMSAPAPAPIAPVVQPAPTQSTPPVNNGPTFEDVQAINGAPSMILDSNDGSQKGQDNKDAPAPAGPGK